MTVTLETAIQRFNGLSTDSKPTGVPAGSTFWAYDTGTMFRCYDGTNWIAYSEDSVVQPGTINLQQAASTYDLFVATGGSVYVEYFSITLPNVNVSDDATITSISVITDTTTVITLLSATAGAKANLTANAAFTYALPFALPVGKKIRLTIAGGASDASTLCITSCRYRAINPAGYLA
jgi:hypothetical protein